MEHGLFYQTHGKQSDNEPALVLIHGLFGNSDNLSVIRRHFEDSHFVVSIDLPDHGKSVRSQSFSFEDYTKRVCLLISELKIKHCVLIGHSLGGKVAMLVAKSLSNSQVSAGATQNGDRENKNAQSKGIQPKETKHSSASAIVDKLIVLDIAPVPYPARHHKVFKGLKAIDLQAISSRSDASNILANELEDKGTQAFLLKSLYQDDNGDWQWRFNLELIMRDYAQLSDWNESGLVYDGPTLFMVGGESNYVMPEHQSTILAQFPQATAKVVPAGHWLHAQKPQIVNALITKFLRG
uniref:alpha/beta fold hydrolase n=1 Tax=Ningiella ruwaisensis TaxID=2364274 RepID=UPI00109FED46|nr:alpha/beta fold hydrolase [Ningiella ruwaisensis]